MVQLEQVVIHESFHNVEGPTPAASFFWQSNRGPAIVGTPSVILAAEQRSRLRPRGGMRLAPVRSQHRTNRSTPRRLI